MPYAGMAFLLAQAAAPATPPAPPPRCEASEYRVFDFWIGEWDVYRAGSDVLNARSKIERVSAGCAIRETWMPLAGGAGGSISGRDPGTGRWHQTWHGASPGPVYFDGGMAAGEMVLTGWWPGSGPNGEDGLVRMRYSRLDDGTVRQHGEFSADHGVSWSTSFDLIYRPKAAAP